MLKFFLDFLFPKRCVSCGLFGQYLCRDCQSKIKFLKAGICPMCERPAIDGVTHPGCQTRYSLDGLISFFRYDGPVKAAIKRLKYKPYLIALIDLLLPSILYSMKSKGKTFANFVAVAVPLHPSREKQRGFNQASLIGKAIAKQLQLQFVDGVLKRTRNTKPQVELKGDERRKNVIDAFAIDPSTRQGLAQDDNLRSVNSTQIVNYTLNAKRYILLVDDVWTTGSTLRTCANVLKRAGAKKVWAMTIAR